MGDAIVVERLGKRYYRYDPDRPWTIHEALLRGLRKLRPSESFWGLRDLSFKVAPGRMVGVVGRNGAGKSTLLRLLGGVGRPDEGSVEVNGRVGALLNLGAGFHLDLTGRENLFVNGVIGGLTRREVEDRLDSIIAFSELEDYIDSPLRVYSTGMQMRLGFSIAIHTRPDILLIDEALAVGDLSFQRKCLDRISRLKSEGCTIIIVSHDVSMIRELCDDALWLRAGRRVAYGPAELVVDELLADVESGAGRRAAAGPVTRGSGGVELVLNENRFGSLEMKITSARLLDSGGAPISEIDSGDALTVEISYDTPQPIDSPGFQVYIHRADGVVCCDMVTQISTPPAAKGRGRVLLHLEKLDLNCGLYYIDVGAYKQDWSYAYDYHYKVYSLVVRQTGTKDGILRPAHHWEVKYSQANESGGPPSSCPLCVLSR